MTVTAGTAKPSGRAAETAARRARILASAVDLAREGGYDAVQMRDVAARAEVALGTLYRHFASKDQLLLAALAEQAGTLQRRLQRRPAAGRTPQERVASALREACRALEREPAMTSAMVQAMFSADTAASPTKDLVRAQMARIISDAVGDDPVDDLDGVIDVLGHVWLATMAIWAGGADHDGLAMGDRLARATALVMG